jgi:phage shock protein A
MDKEYSESEKIEKEITELQTKIKELKKGYESTIHSFAKGKNFL